MLNELREIKTLAKSLEDKGFIAEASNIRNLVESLEATHINNFLQKVLKKSLTEETS